MDAILGASLPVFVFLTLGLFGMFAVLSGQAVAKGWQSPGRVAIYAVLLALANRFLTYALFHGPLLHLSGFVIDLLVLGAIAFIAYRRRLAVKTVAQYPWLYAPKGWLSWQDRPAAG